MVVLSNFSTFYIDLVVIFFLFLVFIHESRIMSSHLNDTVDLMNISDRQFDEKLAAVDNEEVSIFDCTDVDHMFI
jgi:hypothetical protein